MNRSALAKVQVVHAVQSMMPGAILDPGVQTGNGGGLAPRVMASSLRGPGIGLGLVMRPSLIAEQIEVPNRRRENWRSSGCAGPNA